MTHKVLVERLAHVYDPFYVLGDGTGGSSEDEFYRKVMSSEPCGYVDHHDRDEDYHAARVKDMLQRMDGGWVPDPISLDCTTHNGNVLDEVEILDGHHRLIACIFACEDTIEAEFGGSVDLLEWLCGETDTHPTEGDQW